ncbi:aminotransferase class III-fold pyridoxal phosphate-dependent enzyme [Novosphingobium sp. 1949]|uniref:Aminotransferase class III-fold pyridoxal phosphate-dependent enzyme n=1 Tax=Novosphingobium organovorum TaxID=2930092 RepID=A0ABT0BGT5_9SPHN|nr:aminotransferase class III-fold pyridoxal phosphate-dependent enzyme [Novosphingobium organovorum]MCJ2184247.1 aminotransferase class III-fold pyridoxal phosphate-dependent enzyme [Novosphingobium organovorum]
MQGTGTFWMPFTDNRAFKAAPKLFSAASGCHYTDVAGRAVLDGTAGLWCVNAGHGRAPIVEAIREQAGKLDYAPTFQLAHPLVFELSQRLVDVFPAGIDTFFYANSGSEAVDSALKIAFAYQAARGQGQRTRLVGRQRGYHGVGFGGISVGGLPNNKRGFPLLAQVSHLSATLDIASNAFTRGQPQTGADLADELLAIIAEHGAETIAAVIVEPMSGSAGVLVPPVGYLERLREITREHDILLIFDEVITAFGRLGAGTAAERLGVIPDIITTAKGITNGAVPMGCVGVRRAIYDTVIEAAPGGIEFFHGYTYSGHPLAAAAALATLKLYADEDLFGRARELEVYFEDALHDLVGAPHVIDVRNMGMVGGIELAPREGAPGARGKALFDACFEAGVLIRVTGDIVALSPPLIISAAQIDEIVATIAGALERLD